MAATGWPRCWWAQALAGAAFVWAAVSVAQEPELLGLIKVTMVVVFVVGGLGCLWSALTTWRASRSAGSDGDG